MTNILSIRTGDIRLTVSQAAAEFLEREFAASTRKSYAADLKRFVGAFGDRVVGGVQSEEIKTYLANLRDRSGRRVKPSTQNRHFATLSSLFAWLRRQGEVESSPMERLERKRQPESLPRPMTLDQLETFFKEIDSLRDRALFSLLYGSGLRVSEALGLDRENVDLESRAIRVLGKGNRERMAYLSEQTTKLLRKYLRQRGGPKTGPLFASRQGRLSYAMAHNLFRDYAANLPGERPTIHSLRHSFGSERAGNIDALVLRDLMGHKNLRTTQQYAKVNPEAAQRAFEAFDRNRKLVK